MNIIEGLSDLWVGIVWLTAAWVTGSYLIPGPLGVLIAMVCSIMVGGIWGYKEGKG